VIRRVGPLAMVGVSSSGPRLVCYHHNFFGVVIFFETKAFSFNS
jgi:hypothetical protein